MNKNLVKIPLQFFGEASDDDFDDDFDDAFEDDFDDYDDNPDKSSESSEAASSDDSLNADPAESAEFDGDDQSNSTPGIDVDDKPNSDVTASLISELKLMGLEGDDLTSLAASLKARRENEQKSTAARERTDTMKSGKSHIKSGSPGKSADGDVMNGFTSRDVRELQDSLGGPQKCTFEHAKALLEGRIKAKAK